MDGEEASFIVMADGRHALPLATLAGPQAPARRRPGPQHRRHGRLLARPGGHPEVHARAMREIIMPTLAGMAADGLPYTGFLYAGLMIDARGAPRVEFNCRMGDPETQPIMMRLRVRPRRPRRSRHRRQARQGRGRMGPPLRPRRGDGRRRLPGQPRKGDAIHGLPAAGPDDAHVFHAGTTERTARSSPRRPRAVRHRPRRQRRKSAQKRAYEQVDQIHFDGMQCRRDIGYRAVGRRANPHAHLRIESTAPTSPAASTRRLMGRSRHASCLQRRRPARCHQGAADAPVEHFRVGSAATASSPGLVPPVRPRRRPQRLTGRWLDAISPLVGPGPQVYTRSPPRRDDPTPTPSASLLAPDLPPPAAGFHPGEPPHA